MKILPNTIINFHADAIYNDEWLDSVFALLKRHFDVVPITEIESFYCDGHQLKNTCHITFDDGETSFYTKVYPLLKKHQIPVSIYVSPLAARERRNFWFQEIWDYDKKILLDIIKNNNLLGRSTMHEPFLLQTTLKSMTLDAIWTAIHHYRDETGTPQKSCMNMTVDQLRELHDSGLVSIGAHTLNHPILRNESNEKAAYEIKASIDDLGSMLDSKVKYFAYPNGIPDLDFCKKEMDLLKESGVTLSFSTENKSFSRSDNPLSIPRNGLTYGKQFFILMKLIAGSRWNTLRRIVKGKQEEDYRKEEQR